MANNCQLLFICFFGGRGMYVASQVVRSSDRKLLIASNGEHNSLGSSQEQGLWKQI